MQLTWLPVREDWEERLREVKGLDAAQAGAGLRELATSRMEFAQVSKLDRALGRALEAAGGRLPGLEPVRLAILGSATTSHLPAGIRVAGLRRGLAIEVYEAPYGMYWQELMGAEAGASGVAEFRPDAVLLALDARHLAANEGATADAALELMQACWRRAKASFGRQVIQQTVMPVLPELMGSNEARMTGSPAAIVMEINARLPAVAAAEGVDLLALDRMVLADGLKEWHEAAMWHRSKHEVHPRAAGMYGEHVARVVAAARGRSAKCLVLDLDNTLWGGVIGDDGLEGIVLGQGSEVGEAYAEFQRYARRLTERGVILAVCSKNEEKNALEPFARHPEMVLKRGDIACFVANWTDKAANLRTIAKTLNIGLDALVFADDNPAERAIIRRELPMVHVPEMPEEPSEYVTTLAAAGYFEGLRLTEEDRARAEQYQANAERERLRESATDMKGYLESLRMTMIAGPVDAMSLARVTQLVNKTNQFNLMTERLSEAEVSARMNDPRWITLQARLTDRFGDNGIIAVLMARVEGPEAVIETWLMSCRVLGRGVEEACLNLLAEAAMAKGARRMVGMYRPTEKNGMVREMYGGLGFRKVHEEDDGAARWELELDGFVPRPVTIDVNALREAAV
jgi:FkbH-like protein